MSSEDEAPKRPTIAECDAIITAHPMFEMEEIEINGVKQRIWKQNPKNYREYLLPRMEKWADRVMFDAPKADPNPNNERESVTYGEVLQQAYTLAAWLRERGAGVGTRVAIVGFNAIQWGVSFVAIHLIGAAPVIVNAATSVESLVHCLSLVKPHTVLADSITAGLLYPVEDKLKAAGVGELFSWNPVDHIPGCKAKVLDYKSLRASNKTILSVRNGEGLEKLTPDCDGIIFFTSGTTGLPKAVQSTQRAGLHNYLAGFIPVLRAAMRMGAPFEMALMLATTPPEDQPVVLLGIPLFHATGCYGTLLQGVDKGAKTVLMRRWNVDDAVDLIVKHKVTSVGGVPAIPTALINSGKLPPDHEFTAVTFGGAAPQARLAADIQKAWPNANFGQGWGMTELNAIHCMHAGIDYLEHPTAVGVPVPTVGIKIVDPENKSRELPRGQAGLILATGPNMMVRYIGNDKATAETIVDGWLDTGDGGFVDDENRLHIRDRIKDMIIVGGENVPSTEVENEIFTFPGVAEAAAVPLPHPTMGELVGVAVSMAPGAKLPKGDEIVAHVTPKLRKAARPAFVWVSDELLTRNANGKLVKRDIKGQVLEAYKRQSKL